MVVTLYNLCVASHTIAPSCVFGDIIPHFIAYFNSYLFLCGIILGNLADELELTRKCFRALYDEYALQIYNAPDLNEMRICFRQKYDIIEGQIQDMEAVMQENNDAEAVSAGLICSSSFSI